MPPTPPKSLNLSSKAKQPPAVQSITHKHHRTANRTNPEARSARSISKTPSAFSVDATRSTAEVQQKSKALRQSVATK